MGRKRGRRRDRVVDHVMVKIFKKPDEHNCSYICYKSMDESTQGVELLGF